MTRYAKALGGVVVAAALAALSFPAAAHAHGGATVTLHSDGHGSVWITAVWQDGHPVNEPTTATLTAQLTGPPASPATPTPTPTPPTPTPPTPPTPTPPTPPTPTPPAPTPPAPTPSGPVGTATNPGSVSATSGGSAGTAPGRGPSIGTSTLRQTGDEHGTQTWSGTLTPGMWRVSIDVGAPVGGHCQAQVPAATPDAPAQPVEVACLIAATASSAQPAAADDPGNHTALWIAGGVLALGAVAGTVWLRRRQAG